MSSTGRQIEACGQNGSLLPETPKKHPLEQDFKDAKISVWARMVSVDPLGSSSLSSPLESATPDRDNVPGSLP
jgi:hypothetical protein